MSRAKTKNKSQNAKEHSRTASVEKTEGMAFRLKCAKTANGLSHFVMYGDVPKDKAVV